MGEVKRTALYPAHRRARARFFTFSGWEVPLHYGSILDEARSVRERFGVFDVSHMGRLWVMGEGVIDTLNRLVTIDVAAMGVGQVRYGFLCHEGGGILDDLTVSRLGETVFLLVVNAARRESDLEWLRHHLSPTTHLTDETFETVMVAVQGPDAIGVIDSLTDGERRPSELKRFRLGKFRVAGVDCLVSRTGYTGEDGVEIICNSRDGEKLWEALRGKGIPPCGLGARDILRLEAGFCLYGHDLNENTTPAEADLMRFVAMGKPFLGRDSLSRQIAEGVKRKRVGLRLFTRSAPRAGIPVLKGGREIGVVTSSVFSPHLNTAIAMAYVETPFARVGEKVEVPIRQKPHEAEIVPMPFLSLPSRKA